MRRGVAWMLATWCAAAPFAADAKKAPDPKPVPAASNSTLPIHDGVP
jgi:hypothetical protein